MQLTIPVVVLVCLVCAQISRGSVLPGTRDSSAEVNENESWMSYSSSSSSREETHETEQYNQRVKRQFCPLGLCLPPINAWPFFVEASLLKLTDDSSSASVD